MCDQLRKEAGENWTSIRLRVLSRALECAIQLKSPTDIGLGLEFLRAFALRYSESNASSRTMVTESEKALCRYTVSSWTEARRDDVYQGWLCPVHAQY
jgi:hypothetical protein